MKARFVSEIGMIPALCTTVDKSGKFEEAVRKVNPDIIIGNSNGYKLKRSLNIPLVRVGLPIHDRIGAARVLHIGYRGAQQLYDRIVNTLIEIEQEK